MRRSFAVFTVTALAAIGLSAGTPGADWPMWRCDAERSAVSPEALPSELTLRWVHRLPQPRPAWPASQPLIQFDLAYSPVAMGKTLFVPSMVSDRLTAYDTETGAEKWRFYADGPIRFAPVAWKDKVFFASDDGYLYCLNAQTGALVWKFRGGPSDRKAIGNDRLISTWPARGGPVLRDGTIYFAASIWPFMGTFFHALDAESGKVVWTTGGCDSIFNIPQGQSVSGFANIGPQGYLAATEERLIIPGGRTIPAVCDRKSGRILYYNLPGTIFESVVAGPFNILSFGPKEGGYAVGARGEQFFLLPMPGPSSGVMYQLSNGTQVAPTAATILAKEAIIGVGKAGLLAWTVDAAVKSEPKKKEKKANKLLVPRAETVALRQLWRVEVPEAGQRAFLMAGSRVYCGGKGMVAAVETPSASSSEGKIVWQAQFEGDPIEMVAADGKLFVATSEGHLYCFGPKSPGEPKRYDDTKATTPGPSGQWTEKARALVEKTGVSEGYCLALGADTSGLAQELALQSKLHVIVLAPDAQKIAALRRQWDDAGLYGERLAALCGDLSSPSLPPYLASLIVALNPEAMALGKNVPAVQTVFRTLRPYGGVACLAFPAEAQGAFEATVKSASLENARMGKAGDFITLTRAGALPGSADWTHQYADAANTVMSKDSLVRAPLGLLWFGGPSHDKVLPRHGHGPLPQVVGGRVIMEGGDLMRAVDAYTGRLLWEAPMKGVGERFNTTNKVPGANETGSNFASAEDGIYVAYGPAIVRLDPATGKTLGEFRLPAEEDGKKLNWGYLGILDDLLIAGASPISFAFSNDRRERARLQFAFNAPRGEASQRLVGLDRHTGAVLWTLPAANTFRHNAIALGGGKVFCVDGVTPMQLDTLTTHGFQMQSPARLLALDAKTGKELWKATDGVTGTWLAYSAEHDALLEGSSHAECRAPDESGEGLALYRASTGKRLWSKDIAYDGPVILRHDTIITNVSMHKSTGPAYSLLTGDQRTLTHPMTGETIPWGWFRYRGCTTGIGSEHLLTFRSGSASYMDLEAGPGLVSFTGFRSSCTPNLIPADGVLNAPDYTRTCTCGYPNQTSLALVPVASDPTLQGYVETWPTVFYPTPSKPTPARRFGLNFGAAGSHFGPDGTLWLESPRMGGPSPFLLVQTEPATPELLRRHASLMPEDPLNWVNCSAIKGVGKITIWPFVQTAAAAKKQLAAAVEEPSGETNKTASAKSGTTGRKASTLEVSAKASAGRYEKPCLYTVRLYFAELENRKPGERVFDVLLQGKPVLTNFDVAGMAGGANRSVVKEFKGVPVEETLEIGFRQVSGAQPLLCGLQAEAE